MIPKRFRSLPSDAIAETARFGAAVRFSGGVVRWRFRARTDAHTRLAVIVSSRIASKATERNRIRRAVQAAFLPALPAMHPPRDIVVFWRAKECRPDRSEFKRLIEQIRRAPDLKRR